MARGSDIQEKPAYVVGGNSLYTVLAVGAFVGVLGWLLTLGIHNWVLEPVFCRSADTQSVCSNSGLTAWIIAYILVGIVGLFMLIRANIFRPLLVVLAAFATLWTVTLWFIADAWWVGLLWSMGLFAVAYALYTWLASLQKFFVSIALIVVVVILMRLLVVL